MGKQRESKISLAIQHMIKDRGGFCFKVWGNPMMMTGLPDIMCCYHGLYVAFETKTPLGELSVKQEYVHRKMREADAFVFVPRDVQDASEALDEVDAYLSAWTDDTD